LRCFSQATIKKLEKCALLGKKQKVLKTNISLFPADIHTYKLTIVIFSVFFVHLPLYTSGNRNAKAFKKLLDFAVIPAQ